MADLKQLVITEFQERYHRSPNHVVRAPGRVNLIGEHTDYNDGFVLPMTIDRAIWIALSPRDDRRVVVNSLDFPEATDFSLDEILPCSGWESYLRGTAWSLQEDEYSITGWEGVLVGDIPVGAGLSSSAALELAAMRAFWAVSDWEWDTAKMAFAAKRVENEWLGLQIGIMDQMISANGQEGHALLIDCQDMSTKLVPLPQKASVIILDTTMRRRLIDSVYNQRVAQCNAACDFFHVSTLRDLSLETLESLSGGMDAYSRANRPVIPE